MAAVRENDSVLAIQENATLNSAFPFFNWRLMFYLIHPEEIPETDDLKQIPNYANQVVPVFFALIVGELILKYRFTGKGFRVNDTITSLGAGVASQTLKFITRSLDVIVYVWIFEHWRIFTLPMRSWWAWTLAFLAADFAYYWLHRANHEVSILWASHQTHHSSEEYNLSTALRQSMVGGIYGWVVYLPMAFLGFTPVAHVVHVQLNTLNLGPLEWILNTPSHHRVHHGRNPYCIDKNYAGALIIWDRMFGTFEPEHTDENIAYGIISPISSFNGIWVQINSFVGNITRFLKEKSFENKIKCLIMGPGWQPGTKRLGNPEDLPAVENPIRIYDVEIPSWKKIYATIHFSFLILFFNHVAGNFENWDTPNVWIACICILITLGNVGSLLDNRKWIPLGELARCGVFALLMSRAKDFDVNGTVAVAARVFFALSAALWTIVLTFQYVPKVKKATD